MPSIQRMPVDERYKELRKDSELAGEKGDCSVVAVAAVTGRTYLEAHNALKDLGRIYNKGASTPMIEEAIRQLGCDTIECDPQDFIDQYPGRAKGLRNVTTHHPDRYPDFWRNGKSYLFYTHGHVGAVIDGCNVDWTRGRKMHVYRIVEVIKP